MFFSGGGGVLPYMAYTGMCRWTGYGFCSQVYNFYVSVVNRVCSLSYVLNRDLKWIVLSYTGLVFLGGGAFFGPKQSQDFKPSAAPL